MSEFLYCSSPSLDSFGSYEHRVVLTQKIVDVLYGEFNGVFEQTEEVGRSYKWNSDKKIRIYIGTYWPKTFSEVFMFFSSLFKTYGTSSFIEHNGDITILDIGANSLPATAGLIYALKEAGTNLNKITVNAIDLNRKPMEIGVKILKALFPDIDFHFNLCKCNFYSLYSRWLQPKMEHDFILCSKMGNELYFQNVFRGYIKVLKFAENRLKEKGVFYFSDITNKPSDYSDKFFPMIMNKEINKYVRKERELSIVYPIPCGFKAKQCKNKKCFTQAVLRIVNPYAPKGYYYAKFSPKLFVKRGRANYFLSKFDKNKIYTIACKFRENSYC